MGELGAEALVLLLDLPHGLLEDFELVEELILLVLIILQGALQGGHLAAAGLSLPKHLIYLLNQFPILAPQFFQGLQLLLGQGDGLLPC